MTRICSASHLALTCTPPALIVLSQQLGVKHAGVHAIENQWWEQSSLARSATHFFSQCFPPDLRLSVEHFTHALGGLVLPWALVRLLSPRDSGRRPLVGIATAFRTGLSHWGRRRGGFLLVHAACKIKEH